MSQIPALHASVLSLCKLLFMLAACHLILYLDSNVSENRVAYIVYCKDGDSRFHRSVSKLSLSVQENNSKLKLKSKYIEHVYKR
jgi:hypothetical protein